MSFDPVRSSWRTVWKFCLKVAGLQVLKSLYEVILKLQIFCAHILNFNSFKSSQLCKLYLIYIVTCMCWNHCNICAMTYLKGMGQGHILTHTLKLHNLGEGVLNLENLANLIQLTPKIDGLGISGVSDELNIFIWNFAGTYWTFLRWSKTPKKGKGILVWGKFFPFLFVSILCYFISWEPFNIFSWNFIQLFLV